MEATSLGSREQSSGTKGFSCSEFSDELDHVPLARRRRILFGIQQRSDLADCNRSVNSLMFGVKQEEDERCNSQDVPACSSRGVGTSEAGRNCNNEDSAEVFTKVIFKEVVGQSALGNHLQNGNSSHDVGASGLSLSDGSQHIACNESDGKFSLLGNHDTGVCTSSHRLRDFEVSSDVIVECSDGLLHLEEDVILGSFSSEAPKTKIKDECCDYASDDHLDHVVLKERQRMLLSGKLMPSTKPFLEGGFEGFPGGHLQPALKENETNGYAIHKSVASKDTGDNNVWSPPTNFRIKDEPLYNNEFDEDEIDHIPLGDRIKRQRSQDESELRMSNEFSKNSFPFESKYSPIMSERAKAYNFSKLRKRKKTATDSVETALDEDAPGLLQILIDKGILVDEIKLYGEPENDEPIDETSIEDSFTELESVMSKIFAQSQSLLKLAPIQYAKGTKASYCLACLISLVEQARYLRFRKWPAEWGWCRDLQSFIFVFERHNRIVLERPEYGFATYFFELEDSSPIDWQIKRLVIAMKFTNCSRISLIENRAFSITGNPYSNLLIYIDSLTPNGKVGEDMTEGEAKVLIAYGWVPNTGLATMVKYRDRVVHDRKNEIDASEWRSKIGKLLMDGYNGGTVVSMSSPEKLMEFQNSQNAQIKVEIYDT